MALSLFEELQQATEAEDVLVSGFVRNCQILLPSKENVYFTIPALVSQICLYYFFERECFHLVGDGMKLTKERRFITIHPRDSEYNAYGKVVINPSDNMIYEWKFKVHFWRKTGGEIVIGIDNNTKLDRYYLELPEHPFYALSSYGDTYAWKKSSKEQKDRFKYGANDEITMKVNTKTKTIKYKKNNEKWGTVFDNLKLVNYGVKPIQYRMAISMYGRDDELELLSFQRRAAV